MEEIHMSVISDHDVDVGGVSTHYRRGGSGARTVLFLHGGLPGVDPYCGGTHIWNGTLERFAADNQVIAIDMLGSGKTGFPAGEGLTIQAMGEHVQKTLAAMDAPPCHVVGHDVGALVAMWLALNATDRVRSISMVASWYAAPFGDRIDPITFNDPPVPLWGRASQYWAFDRVSYTAHHIDDALIDACVEAAGLEGPRKAREVMADPLAQAKFSASMRRAKHQTWTNTRESRYPAPVQIIWGANDPLSAVDNGLKLFHAIARGQVQTQFHQVNQSGNFVFREHPEQFARLVSGFHEGLEATTPEYTYP
jgi:2-hydroxy-6-oxonona-2,4-dienedioate hydrolase